MFQPHSHDRDIVGVRLAGERGNASGEVLANDRNFTFSFDDFIISFFVAGANTTLPIYIFSSIRRGITPEVNAIGTMVLAGSLILLMTAQFLLRARTNRSPDKGK